MNFNVGLGSDIKRGTRAPENDVNQLKVELLLETEEDYWFQAVAQLRDELLTLEKRVLLDEAALADKRAAP